MNIKKEHIAQLLSTLPECAGVYQYFDEAGTIIYVGKAKNLRRRVSSYFNKVHDSAKTNVLVRKIANIKYTVVNSEEDALHLENSLIKENKPRYNVLLKDDKTYPWIVVRKEHFPRIFLTRKKIKDGSYYYGPYSNVYLAKVVLQLLHEIFPLRTCPFVLTPENIQKRKYKICLQYHIKNCLGPCQNFENESDYNQYIQQSKWILEGKTAQLSTYLREEMERLSEQMKFEQAQKLKEKYQLIETYRSKTVIVSNVLHHIDVFSLESDDDAVFINYLHVQQGTITKSFTFEYRKKLDEPDAEILALAIVEMRTRFESTAHEVVVPFMPDTEFEGIEFHIPLRGDKRKLLEISQQNAKQYRVDRLKQSDKLNPEQRSVRLLTKMQTDFQLHVLPKHIECFDNSNIQGTLPVAACVVFKMGKPSKKDYRHFDIKTVVGPDDFASMREVLYRRYKRLRDEGEPLPQLIVVDGGKGQLSAAYGVLQELQLTDRIAIIGIAKRLEEIFFPNDPIPLYLDKNSESLKVIQHLRNEAHRFGITHHRNKRSKNQVASWLDEISGIGPATKDALLLKYKSIKRIQLADKEELVQLVGKSKAELIEKAKQDTKK